MPDEASLIAALRRAPLAGADALIRAIGIGSQASFSRLVTRAGDRVVAVGRARARRYAAARDIQGLGFRVPLYRIDATGGMDRMATLRPYAPTGIFVDDPVKLPRWMRGTRGNGTFDGLPVFLFDPRPQGFLGRTFAGRHAAELRIPTSPDEWTVDDALLALGRAGEDVVGGLVLGEDAANRVYARWAEEVEGVAPGERPRAFAERANQAIGGIVPGPSAGGEQPKFGAIVAERGAPRHVLVKFSPAEYSAPARRWCDLLVCEHLASECLRANGVASVESEIVEGGSRVFLQTTRFDRVGARGRRAVVSLAAMNGEYVGMPPSTRKWSDAVERLESDRWVDRATVSQVRLVETFGRFIANTDMHFANLAFFPRDDGRLDLAPVYDMLPMGYSPVAGDLPERAYAPPPPEPGHEGIWREAGGLAERYLASVAADERISSSFRAIASENAGAVERALARMGSEP